MNEHWFWRYVRSVLRKFGLLGFTFQAIVALTMLVIFGVFVYITIHVLAAYDFNSVGFRSMVPIIVTGLIVLSGLVVAGGIGLVFTFFLGQMRKALGSTPRSVTPEEPPSDTLENRSVTAPRSYDQRLLTPPQGQVVDGTVAKRSDRQTEQR